MHDVLTMPGIRESAFCSWSIGLWLKGWSLYPCVPVGARGKERSAPTELEAPLTMPGINDDMKTIHSRGRNNLAHGNLTTDRLETPTATYNSLRAQ